MQFQNILILALASIAAANASPRAHDEAHMAKRQNWWNHNSNNNNWNGNSVAPGTCAAINGQCYENNCNGDRNSLACTSGNYRGCPCGFGCGAANGKCSENGCNGSNGRCYGNYLGCSCDMD